VGSLVLGKVNFRTFVGKLVFGGVLVAGLAIAAAGEANSVAEGLLLVLALGAFLGAVNLPIQVLVQTQVPGEILGRAATVLGSLLAASQPVGALAFGAMAGVLPVGNIFVVSGIVISLTPVVLYLPFSALRGKILVRTTGRLQPLFQRLCKQLGHCRVLRKENLKVEPLNSFFD